MWDQVPNAKDHNYAGISICNDFEEVTNNIGRPKRRAVPTISDIFVRKKKRLEAQSSLSVLKNKIRLLKWLTKHGITREGGRELEILADFDENTIYLLPRDPDFVNQ